jgi:hypothetical protein
MVGIVSGGLIAFNVASFFLPHKEKRDIWIDIVLSACIIGLMVVIGVYVNN